MFTSTIKGLENVIQTNNHEKMVIMISGTTGALKSCFTYMIMSRYLDNHPDEIGLYATIEETERSLFKNLKSIGIERNERLHITDYNRTRDMFKEEIGEKDFLDLTMKMVDYTKKENGDSFTLFALDSLNAFSTLTNMDVEKNFRRECFFFFKHLKENSLTSFIIKETSQNGPFTGSEDDVFLSDGLIELGVKKTFDGKKRYIEVVKMRQNRHSMKQFIINVDNGSLSILGPSVDDI